MKSLCSVRERHDDWEQIFDPDIKVIGSLPDPLSPRPRTPDTRYGPRSCRVSTLEPEGLENPNKWIFNRMNYFRDIVVTPWSFSPCHTRLDTIFGLSCRFVLTCLPSWIFYPLSSLIPSSDPSFTVLNWFPLPLPLLVLPPCFSVSFTSPLPLPCFLIFCLSYPTHWKFYSCWTPELFTMSWMILLSFQ